MTRGSTEFEIPDRQWLKTNGWIQSDLDDNEPIFLESIQLFLPSDSKQKFTYAVDTKFEVSPYRTTFLRTKLSVDKISADKAFGGQNFGGQNFRWTKFLAQTLKFGSFVLRNFIIRVFYVFTV